MQVSRHCHFEFEHPVDRLWAVVSDTPRWGEALGLPRYQAAERLLPDGSVDIREREIELKGFAAPLMIRQFNPLASHEKSVA